MCKLSACLNYFSQNCFLYTLIEDSTSLFEKSEAYVSSPVLYLNCETLISPDDRYFRIKNGQLKPGKKKGREGGKEREGERKKKIPYGSQTVDNLSGNCTNLMLKFICSVDFTGYSL